MIQFNSIGQSPNYVFWLNEGDCEGRGKLGIFIDTLNTIEIEYIDSLALPPDSISYSLNGKSITLGPFDHYELKVETPGIYELNAKIWSNNEVYDIDTTFEAVFIPKLLVQYKRSENEKGDEIIKLVIYDLDANNISHLFTSCFTDVKIMDSDGNLKFYWGGNLSFNLTEISIKNVSFIEGDIIEFSHLTLLLKSIEQSFTISPYLQVVY